MSDEKKSKSKKLSNGMYDCERITGKYKGEKVVYHSSTAQTLEEKGHIKVLKKIKKYMPETMKK